MNFLNYIQMDKNIFMKFATDKFNPCFFRVNQYVKERVFSYPEALSKVKVTDIFRLFVKASLYEDTTLFHRGKCGDIDTDGSVGIDNG